MRIPVPLLACPRRGRCSSPAPARETTPRRRSWARAGGPGHPAVAGDHPLPVLWWGSTTPSRPPAPRRRRLRRVGLGPGARGRDGQAPRGGDLGDLQREAFPPCSPSPGPGATVQALPLPAGATQGTALAVVSVPGTDADRASPTGSSAGRRGRRRPSPRSGRTARWSPRTRRTCCPPTTTPGW